MRIILADKHAHVRSALRTMLIEDSDFQIVGEAIDAETLLTLATAEKADLILMDRELPGMPIEEQIASLHTLLPKPTIVVMSSDPDYGRLLLRLGADVFISKGDQPEWLLDTLRVNAARIRSRRKSES